MALGKEKEGGNYISFKPSIGRLTIKSEKGDPEAKPYTYKDPKTQEEVTIYSQRYQNLSGKVVGMKTDTTGEYGPQLKVVVRESQSGLDYTFPVPLNKAWGTKIAEKIASGKLDEEFYFNAYPTFTGNDGKEVEAGVTVIQNGEKLYSRFNYQDNGTWVLKENYPAFPEKDTIPDKLKNKAKHTKFWADYNFVISEFLVDWFDKNMTIEYVAPVKKESFPSEDIDPEDIPF